MRALINIIHTMKMWVVNVFRNIFINLVNINKNEDSLLSCPILWRLTSEKFAGIFFKELELDISILQFS